MTTSKRIIEVGDLCDVLTCGAARTVARDPEGSAYVMERVEATDDEYPQSVVRVSTTVFQVQKTYCLSIRPRPNGARDAPHWRNHVFPDLCDVPSDPFVVTSVEAPLEPGAWRRGYYSKRRWDLQKPAKNKPNTVMSRWQAQMEHDIEDEEIMTTWERTTLSLVRRQALRRARSKRVCDAAQRRIANALLELDDLAQSGSDSADDVDG